jgi:hypothetical protein
MPLLHNPHTHHAIKLDSGGYVERMNFDGTILVTTNNIENAVKYPNEAIALDYLRVLTASGQPGKAVQLTAKFVWSEVG